MKKHSKILSILFVAVSIVLLTSCAGSNFSSTRDHMVETSVTLDQNNFHVVKRVSGEVSADYVLGIGGLGSSYLEHSAISKMYDNANLTGSQTIIDIHVVKSSTRYFGVLFTSKKCIATGTVIEFTAPNTTNVSIVK